MIAMAGLRGVLPKLCTAALVASLLTLFTDPIWAQTTKESHSQFIEERISDANIAVVSLFQRGRYQAALARAKSIHSLAKRALGTVHPSTLISLDNLAFLYRSRGRYDESEPLYLQALKVRRQQYGDEHPVTLRDLNNVASLYVSQNRYGEAEPLFRQALEIRRKVLGAEHPDTLESLSNLAVLYENEGRFAEAEPLFLEALDLSRKVLGAEHQQTLNTFRNLAFLYRSLGQYADSEQFFIQALEVRHKALGAEHPDTLMNVRNLALLYGKQGRVGEAEDLFLEALARSRKVLGAEHPTTISTTSDLALLYRELGRYEKAEPLLLAALELRQKVLGAAHLDTLISLNNLALLYENQGREAESKALFLEALELSSSALGALHPITLSTDSKFTESLVRLGNTDIAATRLKQVRERMVRWSRELPPTSRRKRTKSMLLNSISSYQDVSIHLATLHPSDQTRRLAADAILHWIQLAGEEEVYLNRLIRTTDDGRVRTLGQSILSLRDGLIKAYGQRRFKNAEALLAKLDEKEQHLSTISAEFFEYRSIRSADSRDIEAALPEGSALVAFRRYQPYDYAKREFGWPRWAAVLLRPLEEPLFADLGWILKAPMLNRVMGEATTEADRDETAARLYENLFGEFEVTLAKADTVYIAPDGALNQIPCDLLRLHDGRYWMERHTIRVVDSGRALLETR